MNLSGQVDVERNFGVEMVLKLTATKRTLSCRRRRLSVRTPQRTNGINNDTKAMIVSGGYYGKEKHTSLKGNDYCQNKEEQKESAKDVKGGANQNAATIKEE
jgi:hypothetical protein